MNKKDIVCWWSGGITSAVACLLAIETFGPKRCRVIMIDTRNEDDDTYRFMNDCAALYGLTIEKIGAFKNTNNDPNYTFVDIGKDFETIRDVWFYYKSLNVARGAICSTVLKREVREKWQKDNFYNFQVFGYEFDKKEFNRSLSMTLNHGDAKAIYPLMMFAKTKKDCISIFDDLGIKIPAAYYSGVKNNNCFKTGCVQGGVGYWQHIKKTRPNTFNNMADVEHELTILKGAPVTMLKDQSKEAKQSGFELVFLRKNPLYPQFKSIDEMPKCKIEPLIECNGFCGTNDLIERNPTELQINFAIE